MYLNRIQAKCFMGRNFDFALSPVTVIYGPNDSGKTAVMNAIKLCFVQSLKDLRDKQIKPVELASGPIMTVRADASDGGFVSKSFGTKVSSESTIGPLPPVLMDSRVYFGLSGPARTDFVVQQNADSLQSFKPEALIAEIAKLTIEDPDETSEKVIKDLLKSLRQIQEPKPLAWMDKVTELVGTSAKTAKANAMTYSQTINGLTALDELYSNVPLDVADLESKLKGLSVSKSNLSQQIGALNQAVRDYNAKLERIEEIKEELEEADDVASLIAAKDAEIRELENITNGFVNTGPALAKAIQDLHNIALPIERENAGLSCAIEALAARINKANALKCCPECGVANDSFAQYVGALESQRSNLVSQSTANDLKLTEAKNLLSRAIEDRELSDKQNTIHLGQMKELTNLRLRRDALKKRQDATAALRTSLATLSAAQAPDKSQLEGWNKSLAEISQKEQELIGQIKKSGEAKAHNTKVSQAKLEKHKADIEASVFTAAVNKIKESRAELAKKVVDSLLEPCNRMIAGICKFELAYKDGEIGHFKQGKFVAHDLFSGIGSALTYVAISVALSGQSPIRLVLLDEATRLDAQNKAMFARRMLDLVSSGQLDQCIMIDTTLDPYKEIEGLWAISTIQ